MISFKCAAAAAMLLMASAGCAAAAPASAFVYKNEGDSMFVVYHGTDEVTIRYGGAVYGMKEAVSASGARYTVPGDDQTEFWSKGHDAWLTISGSEVPGTFRLAREFDIKDSIEVSIAGEKFLMTRVPAENGVRYEAADDPTTSFESSGRSSIVTLRGERLHTYVLFSTSNDGRDIYLSADGESFILERRPSTSGMRYEAIGDPSTYFVSDGDAAALFVRGVENTGYDASIDALAAIAPDKALDRDMPEGEFSRMPRGAVWSVTSVKGVPRDDGTTIVFSHSSRLHGKAAVNSYTSSWIATRGRILIERPASTKMMGPPEAMDAENAFFDALAEVRRFEISGGVLILYTKDGSEITAIRSDL